MARAVQATRAVRTGRGDLGRRPSVDRPKMMLPTTTAPPSTWMGGDVLAEQDDCEEDSQERLQVLIDGSTRGAYPPDGREVEQVGDDAAEHDGIAERTPAGERHSRVVLCKQPWTANGTRIAVPMSIS